MLESVCVCVCIKECVCVYVREGEKVCVLESQSERECGCVLEEDKLLHEGGDMFVSDAVRHAVMVCPPRS